jgi:acyl-CoA thioester hydrolase
MNTIKSNDASLRTVTDVHIRYSDVDTMGVVYNVNYFLYFEDARTDFLLKFGMTYLNIHEHGILTPVIESTCHYDRPLFFRDQVQIETSIIQASGVKVSFRFDVCANEETKPRATGMARIGFVDELFQPVNIAHRWPELYRGLMNAYRGIPVNPDDFSEKSLPSVDSAG